MSAAKNLYPPTTAINLANILVSWIYYTMIFSQLRARNFVDIMHCNDMVIQPLIRMYGQISSKIKKTRFDHILCMLNGMTKLSFRVNLNTKWSSESTMGLIWLDGDCGKVVFPVHLPVGPHISLFLNFSSYWPINRPSKLATPTVFQIVHAGYPGNFSTSINRASVGPLWLRFSVAITTQS